ARTSSRPSGHPLARWSRQSGMAMVKPGGTGSPSTAVISARPAPLPPSSSARVRGGTRWAWSKAYTGNPSGMVFPSGVSGKDLAAVDEQGLSGDESAGLAQQERDGAAHVGRRGDPAQRRRPDV